MLQIFRVWFWVGFVFLCGAQSGLAEVVNTSAAPEKPVKYMKLPKAYRYRVSFRDKANNTYSLRHPEAFLSKKALERRKKYRIKVDEYDLPVTSVYLEYLYRKGFKIVHTSKWNNTAVVETADTALVGSLEGVKFITGVRKVWESPDSVRVSDTSNRRKNVINSRDTLPDYYGHARCQVSMIGVDSLHSAGFRGDGITIAVIDGGFYNADCVAALRTTKILGTRNFVKPGQSVYDAQPHGMMVLSCIAANFPHSLVGTAPDASFYLLMSEDDESENIIEEDHWCAAIEYADSVGVDIVTSSLGYYTFDDSQANHKYYEQDGETAVNSRAASLAASRGLIVLNSAGNSGDEDWKKIGFPADAKDILAVGAVTEDRKNTVFSSLGNTADGRIKPDVMAMGLATWLLDFSGSVSVANGTSFSTPLMCGGVACLLQAFPMKRPEEIIRAVQLSGDNAGHPDNVYGYGIPDLWKAYQLLKRR